jgi:hypothetical protein
MTEEDNGVAVQAEDEIFPLEPRYHPIHRIPRKIYDALASAKLAMVLLVLILICCVVGVTIYRGAQANLLIFNALWFNALLVLLVVNVACCFFGRIWGRRVTVISFGMILFHLSFVTMFLGVVYNSLFYFRGNIRLTEGETLPNSDPQSYDLVDKGRYFSYGRLKGDTALIAMHAGYKIDGKDKRVAYEVEVGDGDDRKRDILYVTKYLEYGGVKYFRDREGYSLLVTLSERVGDELYGAFVPLQSYKQKNESFRYATGSKMEEGGFLFPHDTPEPLFDLKLVYLPTQLKERGGAVEFEVRNPSPKNSNAPGSVIAVGKSSVGGPFTVGDYILSVKEARYWVAMQVAYEPGQPIILSSLWAGLFGVTLTTLGRIFRKRKSSAGK